MTEYLVDRDEAHERGVGPEDYTVVEEYDFSDVDGIGDLATVEVAPKSEQAAILDDLPNEIGQQVDDLTCFVQIAPEEQDRQRDRNQNDSLAVQGDIQWVNGFEPAEPFGMGGGEVAVVMDSGIWTDHPAFDHPEREENPVLGSVDVTGTGRHKDDIGHGTACAGLITTIAPQADLIALRIFDESGQTGEKPIMRAYEWLFKNIDEYGITLANISWGATKTVDTFDRLQNKLVEAGVRDTTAAGNTGGPGGSPATASSAFSVGAVDQRGELTDFTSYNDEYSNPEVVAVGKNVRLAQATGTSMGRQLSGQWISGSGTSFSAPIICGLMARWRSREDNTIATPAEVAYAYTSTAKAIPNTPREGAGIADHSEAVGQTDHIDKRERKDQNFEEYIGERLREEYGEDRVTNRYTFPDCGNEATFLIEPDQNDDESPGQYIVVELENSTNEAYDAAARTIMDCVHFRDAEAELIVPAGTIDPIERKHAEEAGCKVTEVVFDGDTSGV
jgi:subtilisin family serine protease